MCGQRPALLSSARPMIRRASHVNPAMMNRPVGGDLPACPSTGGRKLASCSKSLPRIRLARRAAAPPHASVPIYPPPPPTFALAKRLLPFLFLLLGVIAIGVLAFLLLAPSDTALANPPSQSGETSGYDGPAPTPVPEHRVPVDWPLIPSGLGPGDSFRLLFLTSNKGDATSGNINTYISRVQNRADAGHTAIKPYANDFRPVISTAAPSYIGAQEVLSFSSYNTWIPQAAGNVPVYWLNGAKVADASWDFFDDSWDSHDARNEWGASMANISLSEKRAWTGSSHDGWGWYPAGEDWVRTGMLRTYDEIEDDARPKGEDHRLYAMSPVFTVDHTRARATFGVIGGKA